MAENGLLSVGVHEVFEHAGGFVIGHFIHERAPKLRLRQRCLRLADREIKRSDCGFRSVHGGSTVVTTLKVQLAVFRACAAPQKLVERFLVHPVVHFHRHPVLTADLRHIIRYALCPEEAIQIESAAMHGKKMGVLMEQRAGSRLPVLENVDIHRTFAV